MSFFGFNTTLPRDRGHPVNAPGFGQAPDPFESLGRHGAGEDVEDEDEDALDFEETYDGLGDQLDETDDVLNDETFGDVPTADTSNRKPVGKDYDFFGQTAQVSDALNEEHLRYTRQQLPTKSTSALAASPPKPAAQPAQPARTGYEKYQDPAYIPDLQANASLWGVPSKKATDAPSASHQRQSSTSAGAGAAAPSRKMMSLEEVEAAMRAQSKKRTTTAEAGRDGPPPAAFAIPQVPETLAQPQILRRPAARADPMFPGVEGYPTPGSSQPPLRAELPTPHGRPPAQILQRPMQGSAAQAMDPRAQPPQPRQILQNPNRQTSHQSRPSGSGPVPTVSSRPMFSEAGPAYGPHMAHGQASIPGQPPMLQLSEEERAAFLAEEAKRAKRNHKIFLLSKNNGLMTPQDKNFITRIQLQQLVSATGDPSQAGTDAALAEDFYYQVHRQIQGGGRRNPQQPLNHFAQTYLFQTGGRPGAAGNRRLHRPGDSHLQRMEQQVQRAVEAAKSKPKNQQLVIEGSLGKISFSNAKTPKPLLNLKRAGGKDASSVRGGGSSGSSSTVSISDRKSILRNIEAVYVVLMEMEDHERHLPRPGMEGDAEGEVEWQQTMQALNEKLWTRLKVTEPIIPNSPVPHPFIAFLSFAKGKKAIPRIFRHIDAKQRVTIMTMIVVHLGVLDVVRRAQLQGGEYQLPAALREEVELFSQAVMPALFGYVSEAPLNIVVGLFAILLDSTEVQVVARSKIGVSVLTMFLSRAELMKQGGAVDEEEWQQWTALYNRLFDSLEPILGQIFPGGSLNTGEDVYVWQFLAALGLCANPEQQQRLVMAVKDRVMETVTQAKTLPAEMSAVRLGNVNLFMRAIGLDVELLG